MRIENDTQRTAVAGVIAPAAATAAAASSWLTESIDASIYARLVAYVQVGFLAGAATLITKFQHCSVSASADAGWADVNASCVTSTYTSAGANGSVGELELRLDQNPSVSRYVRALASNATSTWNGSVLVTGIPMFRPGKDVDSALVKEIVVY